MDGSSPSRKRSRRESAEENLSLQTAIDESIKSSVKMARKIILVPSSNPSISFKDVRFNIFETTEEWVKGEHVELKSIGEISDAELGDIICIVSCEAVISVSILIPLKCQYLLIKILKNMSSIDQALKISVLFDEPLHK